VPLPGGEVLDLGGTVVPDLVDVVLAGHGSFRGVRATAGRLALAVPTGEQDAVLLAALQAGWSVLTVGPRR
jgi:hypothetical protein